jgi:hypothetical protein
MDSNDAVKQFCDERMKEALETLTQTIAEDAAEDAAKASGFHPDYFMPVGRTYKRTYPGALNG